MIDSRAGDTNLPLLPIRVPGVLTATAKWLAGIRFGTDWGAIDYLDDRVEDLDVPILLYHGVADDDVPIALSRELADRRPDIVQLVESPEAGHVRSWNVDPQRYETVLGEFLDALP